MTLLTRRRMLGTMAGCAWARDLVLDAERFRGYIESFNANDPKDVAGAIPNARAWEWMRGSTMR